MTRRPAPSALLLHKGPPPARGQSKHTIPMPPPPTFAPSATISRGRSGSVPTFQPMINDATVLPQMQQPLPSRSSARLLTQWHVVTSIQPIKGSSQPDTKIIPPWNRSRSFSFAKDQGMHTITPLKPVVPNPLPVWAW